MRKSCALAILLLVSMHAAGAADRAPLVAIGHVPIAVKDLDRASADYRALGFALKAGRLHDNSLLNAHAKYPNGTELELISASRPADELARKYLALIARGDGPVFVALEATDPTAVETRLNAAGFATRRSGPFLSPTEPGLDYFFFVGDNRSPTDEPAHFAHANTTTDLVGICIADSENRRLVEFFQALGGRVEKGVVVGLGADRGYRIELARGAITLIPKSRREHRDRPIVGVTLATRDIDAARRSLQRSSIPVLAPVDWPPNLDRDSSRRIYVAAPATHGLWIEFREAPGHH